MVSGADEPGAVDRVGAMKAFPLTAICFVRSAVALAVLGGLSGCFVRLPMRGTPELRARVGSTVRTKMEISIFTMADGKIAIDPKREESDVGAAQRKIMTLPKDTLLTVKGLVYRRCPWGLLQYYVCRAPAERIKFDIQIGNSEKFLGWPLAPAAQLRYPPTE